MTLSPIKLLSTLHHIFVSNIENQALFRKAEVSNPWFTEQNCKTAFESWAYALREESATEWCKLESLGTSIKLSNKKVGLILAGNLPLVGLHDIICTIITGHFIIIKPSSQDSVLIKWIIDEISIALPELKERIEICEGFIKNADAYIGTGSNNSARYFEYYFKDKPNLIRKNRTSVAILDEDISDNDLKLLSKDVFSYFGMGCRNVTHLFVPEKFDFEKLFRIWQPNHELINHHKYANNYTYHKAILLMNLDKHFDTGYLIMVEREQIQSPVALLSYSYYTNKEMLRNKLNNEKENIQCIVSGNQSIINNTIAFGETQSPELWDYADGINTIVFLKGI
ncbi:MAG: acyl-CoA reductase [Bacteroidetes bacterium]|nr:acyl-CoA reductase [Bacteroidota bacterium]